MNTPALPLGQTPAWYGLSRPSPLLWQLFQKARAASPSPNCLAQGDARQVRILPWDFYNWTRDRKSLGGGDRNYKMWNSGTISSLPCGGNQSATSTNEAKMDRKVPRAPKHLVPITAEPNPIPVLLVWLLISLCTGTDLQNPPNI